eukprot:gene4357-1133_t
MLRPIRSPPNRGRAWFFARGAPPGTALVRAVKRSWAGCNDGGALRVLQLRPSELADTTAQRPGASASWAAGARDAAGGGPGPRGGRDLWPVFAAPCEACTLELTLCRTRAADPADCDSAPPASESDARPLLSARRRVTAPVAVRAATGAELRMHGQRVPLG